MSNNPSNSVSVYWMSIIENSWKLATQAGPSVGHICRFWWYVFKDLWVENLSDEISTWFFFFSSSEIILGKFIYQTYKTQSQQHKKTCDTISTWVKMDFCHVSNVTVFYRRGCLALCCYSATKTEQLPSTWAAVKQQWRTNFFKHDFEDEYDVNCFVVCSWSWQTRALIQLLRIFT